MEIIKPTKKQVFDELRASGCCWVPGSNWKCQCESRQIKYCYEAAEERLTRIIYTPEEEAQREAEGAKTRQQIDDIISDICKDI